MAPLTGTPMSITPFESLRDGDRQFQRQVQRVRTVDLLAERHLVEDDLVGADHLAVLDAVLEVEREATRGDAIAGELDHVG